MKKNYLKLISSFLLAGLLVTSCQKSITENAVTKNSNEATAGKLSDASLKNQCQLTYFIDWGGYPNWVNYNAKGLADEWRVEFSPDFFFTSYMQYGGNNLLSNAQIHINDILVGTIEFVWTGNHITTEHVDFSGYLYDIVNTYNAQGQLIIRETSDGWRTNYTYTPEGNHQRDIIYYYDEPIQSDDYTYTQPNKNPYLAIQGLPYLFLYYNPMQTKWFATSDKFTIYDNGNPFVILDIDPSKTVMEKTDQNYLSSSTYYDILSGEYLSKNFEYQNCGSSNNGAARVASSKPSTNLSGSKKSFRRSPLLIGKPEERVKQITELKRQYLKK